MHCDAGYISTTEKMHHCSIRAHCEQLTDFVRGRIIGLKEAGWRIARHMGRSNAAIGKCWQEWVNNVRFQCHDGSGQPRATADRKDILIGISAFTVPDSTLSTIRHATRSRVSP
ncbi:HTH_Tnp_Tc3_2 domain-containing protein [Trichonephila clavipes]|nr:HTH_Tnp_Tc3_2 domain-containing protein [Trichonephila clavipes]